MTRTAVALLALALIAAVVFGVREVGQVYAEATEAREKAAALKKDVTQRDEVIAGLRQQITERKQQQEDIHAQSLAIQAQRADLDRQADDLRRRVGEWLRIGAARPAAAACPVPVPAAPAGAQPAAPAGPVPGTPPADVPGPTVDVEAFAKACVAAARAADIAESDLNRVIVRYREARAAYCAAVPEGC